MVEPIIFYDIPSAPGKPVKTWGPNTWKTRYTLNYKGLPYKTEWVEYPDIEALCKRLGAPPTGKKPDGRDQYTLPVIYDPSTKKAVADSLAIAKYLDSTYPDTPQVVPPGLDAFQAVFLDSIVGLVVLPGLLILLSRIAGYLGPQSAEYFRTTREERFGAKLEDMNKPEQWEALEQGFGKVKDYILANGEGKDLVLLGNKSKITFSDIQIASVLIWLKTLMGENSEDWKRVAGFQDGFWLKFMKQFEQFGANQ